MTFKLIREFNRETFKESAAWGQYYEPGDIDTLAECGYDRQLVHDAIKGIDWSDDYWFPIPESADAGLFQFEKRQAQFHTASGRILDGFVCNEGHAIGLFGLTDYWMINQNLMSMFEDKKSLIIQDLELRLDEDLLPLHYCIEALGSAKIFPTRTVS